MKIDMVYDLYGVLNMIEWPNLLLDGSLAKRQKTTLSTELYSGNGMPPNPKSF